MSLYKIYSRYAKSLIEISQESGELESTIENTKYFQKVAKVKDFSNLLKNPVLKPGLKIKIFDSIFKGKVNDIFYKFLIIVIKKGRERLLPFIVDEVLAQNKRKLNITDINLTTAVDLPTDFISKLKKSMLDASILSKNLDIHTNVDKDIIGGFILEVEDKLLDSSVKSKLRKIKKNIIEDKYIRVI